MRSPDKEKVLMDRLLADLQYDASTGDFRWLRRMSQRVKASTLAGSVSEDGYRTFAVKSRFKVQAHRLAWYAATGVVPCGHIDHIDGNRLNNRIDNLRVVLPHENQQNRFTHREGKLWGACYSRPNDAYMAVFNWKGQRVYSGWFKTRIEAHEASVKAAKKIGLNLLGDK